MNRFLARIARGLAACAILAVTAHSAAQASPLSSGNWLQVGNMAAGGGMFNGNCNLSSTCTYALDAHGDFWTSFDTFAGQEILFVTGNNQVWALSAYEDVIAHVNAAAGFAGPNIAWIDAGLGGISIGSVTGNILQRHPLFAPPDDPWITLQGPHCLNNCAQILWGEGNYASGFHETLKNASGGVQVYVTSAVPLPAALPLLAGGIGLLGLLARRRKAAAA